MQSRRPLMLTYTIAMFAGLACSSSVVAGKAARDGSWQAGFAKVVITPDEPMWMTGYGGRTKPAEGQVHELYAKAAALRDAAGKTVVFVSTDLIGISAEMSRVVCDAIEKEFGLDRSEIMLTSSHTHCGPALDHKLSHMLAMTEEDWAQVRKYQQILNAKLIAVIAAAIGDLKPARISAGSGICRFASNRRAPIGLGPYDHDVPVLRVTSVDGSQLRGVIYGYACHSTTLSFYKWCGDYSGFASQYLEERHPGSVALFFAGCGGDQNPLPRRRVEWAEKYGRMLAIAVDKAMAGEMMTIDGNVRSSFTTIALEFDTLPSEEELKQRLESQSRYERARASVLLNDIATNGSLSPTYPYPIQVWQFDDKLTWVALGGEVVVDYALRLKNELGAGQTWVAGYSNDVMAYIPSERVLAEGGYEGERSMVPYQQPSRWKGGLEKRIIDTVFQTSRELRRSTRDAK